MSKIELTKEIREIADHYGILAQMDQTKEECAELIQAICKYKRALRDKDPKAVERAYSNIEEEIADVEIMLAQIKYLFRIPERQINGWKDFKIRRQIGRIKAGQEKTGND